MLRFFTIVNDKRFRIIVADKFVGGEIVIPVEDSDDNGYGDPTKDAWLDYSEIFDLLEKGEGKQLVGCVMLILQSCTSIFVEFLNGV